MKIRKKLFLWICAGILLVAACGVGACYFLIYPHFRPTETRYIHIYEDRKDFDALCRELVDSADCRAIEVFKLLAKLRQYPENIKSGRYAVEPKMSSIELLNRLRRGQQSPVRLTFNNIRLTTDLATRLSEQLMMGVGELQRPLDDEKYCQSLGFNTQTISSMFIPNTYEVYWNIPVDKLMERMKREFDAFWNESRRRKAENMRLTPVEVATLASIVEEETAAEDEYARVAGLYVNRLYKGMLLQADPTVKFAVGDFSLRRILNVHLAVESPYNTYLHEGLPPGPIRIPSPKSIDAVLNYEHHNYLYMCAKENFSGRHNFAVTLAEHTRNANLYHKALNRRR
ncbi:MAG: endolytic transglycosylase MltG [Tannerella sp.]|jgi:UPF0755 protein|nr:endolytic transglycosylase MltG [Tannerella sp.]